MKRRTHGYEWSYVLTGRLRVAGDQDLVLLPSEAAEFDAPRFG